MNKQTDKPLNGKAPRFRQYLEEEGILDYLTVELMSLFKAGSPKGGLEILRNNISKAAVQEAKLDASKEAGLQLEALEIENEALKYRVQYLETENKKFSLQIEDLKKRK